MGILNWLFGAHEEENPDGVSVFEPTEEEETIDNACTLLAADELTGQNQHSWHPDVIGHIKANKGVTDPGLIEKHAAVVSHSHSEITCYEDGSLLIESERGAYDLDPDEKLIITYSTSPGRGHSVCISAEEFDAYARRHEITHIFTSRD
jgi:hypothetical protein